MFKTENFELELMKEMEKNLIGNEVENKWSFDKIARAADYIASAAEIFDDTGMHKEAEILTRMLEKIASGKGESETLMHHTKETGTPFPMIAYHAKGDKNKLDENLDSVDINMDDEDWEEEV